MKIDYKKMSLDFLVWLTGLGDKADITSDELLIERFVLENPNISPYL